MIKKLKVPLAKQKDDFGCGPTTMGMVFNYFGEQENEAKILAALGGTFINKRTKHAGTFCVENAQYARNMGFNVICYTYNLDLFEPSAVHYSKNQLRRHIVQKLKEEKDKINLRILKAYLNLIDSGVDFRVKMPSLAEYRKFIDKKLPVMVAVNSKIYRESDSSNNWSGHYIALIGYSSHHFYFNDPIDGKEHKISDEKLWFALSNNILGSSAYMVVISNGNSKKKSNNKRS